MDLPFSQACENNKAVILEVLQRYFADVDYVLEVHQAGSSRVNTHSLAEDIAAL